MSTRRQRTHACASRLASVLLFIAGTPSSWTVASAGTGDATTNSSPASASQPASAPVAAQTPTNRTPSRPRPAFWQGDSSLTEEQKTTLRSLTQSYRQENKPQLESLQRLRRELEELVFAPTPDPSAIQAKVGEIAIVEGQLAMARARMIQELRPRLSPDQLERLKSLRGTFELSERFSVTPTSTNRNALPRRPAKRAPEPDASGSANPRE